MRGVPYFRTGAALLLGAVGLLAQGCLEQIVVVDPETGDLQVLLRIQPDLAGSLANTPESLRLTGLALEIRDAATGELIVEGAVPLDPGATTHDVEVSLSHPPDEPLSIEGSLRITGESGRIEWSGRFGPLSPPELQPEWDLAVQMGRGDLANLGITSIVPSGFGPVAAEEAGASVASAVGDGRLVEGDGGIARVDVVGGPEVPDLFWGSRTPDIVVVDGEGRFETRLPGAGQIVVAAGLHAVTIPVSVLQRVVGLRVEPADVLLDALGAETSFVAVALDPRGGAIEGRVPTWSGGGGVVESLGGGRFRSTAPGTGVVRASLEGVEATGTARVVQVVTGLDASPASLEFTALGDVLPVTARPIDRNGFEVAGQPVTWSSTNAGVVSVDGATARSNGVGTAELVATLGSFSARVPVAVTQVVHGVAVTPEEAEASVGSDVEFRATAVDRNGNLVPDALTIAWESTNPGVATVDATGTAHAVSEGEARIVASSGTAQGSALLTVTASEFGFATVLYFADYVVGTDAILPGLQAMDEEGTIDLTVAPTDYAGVLAAIDEVDPDVLVYFNQNQTQPSANVSALVSWIASGRRLIYADWTRNATVYAALDASTSAAGTNRTSATFTDERLAVGVEQPMPFFNPGWGVFTMGADPTAGGDSACTFGGTDDSCVIYGNDGRTALVGFLSDTVSESNGTAFIRNLLPIVGGGGELPEIEVLEDLQGALAEPVDEPPPSTERNALPR